MPAVWLTDDARCNCQVPATTSSPWQRCSNSRCGTDELDDTDEWWAVRHGTDWQQSLPSIVIPVHLCPFNRLIASHLASGTQCTSTTTRTYISSIQRPTTTASKYTVWLVHSLKVLPVIEERASHTVSITTQEYVGDFRQFTDACQFFYCYTCECNNNELRYHVPASRVGGIKRWCASDVWRLSVAYIEPKSRTERPRKTKIGTEVAHVTRDSDITFKVERSTCRGRGHIVAASRTAC